MKLAPEIVEAVTDRRSAVVDTHFQHVEIALMSVGAIEDARWKDRRGGQK